jgi:TRAP-type C4-dicarboxylate transport system permease small subunit
MWKQLWWVMCLAGVAVIAAALLLPRIFWNAASWRQLEHTWGQVADARGWGVGFREGFILVGMSTGALLVVGGLVASLAGRKSGALDRLTVPPPPGPASTYL